MAADPITEIRYWKNARWREAKYDVGNAKGIQLVIYHPATLGVIGSATRRADTPAEELTAKRFLVTWANALAAASGH
jgi:hypothetical protein